MPVFANSDCVLFERRVIMEDIKTYLLSITAAAIICTAVRSFSVGRGPTNKLLQVITGLFMSVTLISPVIQFDLSTIPEYFTEITENSEQISADGVEASRNAMSDIIKQKLESYILDETKRLGSDLDVEVKVSESNPPEPYQVILSGSISPYHKKSITEFIAQNLGIPQERQLWR